MRSVTRKKLLSGPCLGALSAVLSLAGCSSPVDTSELEPVDGYQDWYRVETAGAIPGHGDTYRIIYVNDVARSYAGVGEYPVGSVVIKEIRALTEEGGPGDLNYTSLMRKLDEPAPGGELDSGWLFTIAGEVPGDEAYNARCWSTCHAAAPYDGVFLEYGE